MCGIDIIGKEVKFVHVIWTSNNHCFGAIAIGDCLQRITGQLWDGYRFYGVRSGSVYHTKTAHARSDRYLE